jgi:uncharacterized Tic20 family protein
MNDNRPTQDDRVMAALAHGSAILFGMGAIAAVVIWATQKDKSRYVAFQALQALLYQIAGFFAYIVGMCCWLALYFASFIPLMAAANQASSEPPLFFFVSLALMVVPFALMGLWIVGGLWGAVRTLQGRNFHYLIIGNRLERWLAA